MVRHPAMPLTPHTARLPFTFADMLAARTPSLIPFRAGVGIWLTCGLLVYLLYGIHHSALNDAHLLAPLL
jgi:hypothetical protein